MSGSKQSVFDQIDALDDAADVKDLVRRLKPILVQLAFNAVTGDDSYHAHEEWHETYADHLYNEAAEDAAAGSRQSARAEKPRAVRRVAGAAPNLRQPDLRQPDLRQPARTDTGRIRASRPNKSDLPDSLRRIMDGTHESLHGD